PLLLLSRRGRRHLISNRPPPTWSTANHYLTLMHLSNPQRAGSNSGHSTVVLDQQPVSEITRPMGMSTLTMWSRYSLKKVAPSMSTPHGKSPRKWIKLPPNEGNKRWNELNHRPVPKRNLKKSI